MLFNRDTNMNTCLPKRVFVQMSRFEILIRSVAVRVCNPSHTHTDTQSYTQQGSMIELSDKSINCDVKCER